MPGSKYVLVFGIAALVLTGLPVESKIYQIGLVLSEPKGGRLDSEILNAATTALFESKRFTVIERAKLDAIFAERELSDFVQGTPGDLSALEGLDMLGLVTYTIEHFTNSDGQRYEKYFIDIRMTNVRSGQVMGTVSSRRSTFLNPTSPHQAGQNLLQNIREMFPPEGYVVRVSGDEVIVDLGVESGVRKGDLLEIIREGETLFHPVTGKPLPAVEIVVGTVKVIDTVSQMSYCKIKPKKGRGKNGSTQFAVADRVRLKPKGNSFGEFFKGMLRN